MRTPSRPLPLSSGLPPTRILEAGPQPPLLPQLLTGALSRTHCPCHSSQSLARRLQHLSLLETQESWLKLPLFSGTPAVPPHSSTEPGSLQLPELLPLLRTLTLIPSGFTSKGHALRGPGIQA